MVTLISKHWLASIRVDLSFICRIQIQSHEVTWIVIGCRWVSIDVWKAISWRLVICIHHCLKCLIVACHHVSIIYFCKLVGVHWGITWSISIVVWNHISTAISSCALTLWCADWTCWTVRACCTIWCCNNWKNIVLWTLVWIINYLVNARVTCWLACISRGNIHS